MDFIVNWNKCNQANELERVFSCFITDRMVVVAYCYLILTFQNYLPFRYSSRRIFIDLAVNTAISFITDTNLQHYAGDQQLSVTFSDGCNNFYNVYCPSIRNCGCICIYSFFYTKELWTR